MANAYIRYTVNGEKIGSHGDNTSGARQEFEELRGIISGEVLTTWNDYITPRKEGDVVLAEFLKRGRKKPRTPRDSLSFIVTERIASLSR